MNEWRFRRKNYLGSGGAGAFALTPESFESTAVFKELPLPRRAPEELFAADAAHARLRDLSAFNDDAPDSLIARLRDEVTRPLSSPLFA